jgi:hypothetical protein
MLSTAWDSPEGEGLIFTGVVIGLEVSGDGLNDEQNHVWVFVCEQAREVQENAENGDRSERIAEENLEASGCEENRGESGPFHAHDGEGLIEGLINRICSSFLGHGLSSCALDVSEEVGRADDDGRADGGAGNGRVVALGAEHVAGAAEHQGNEGYSFPERAGNEADDPVEKALAGHAGALKVEGNKVEEMS